jgi:hypothetical protein
MKLKRSYTVGLIALAVSGLAAIPAVAATAAGPYYATPSWDQTLPSNTRFIVLSNFNSDAVLDRETGLVWERSPSTSTNSWYNSLDLCANLDIGGRKGWRLPSISELASLLDTGSAAIPLLPAGHPFLNVQSSQYWAAAIRVGTAPWVVNFSSGSVNFVGGTAGPNYRWCVRGGQNNSRDY